MTFWTDDYDIYGVVQNSGTVPKFLFCDNFQKHAPILTIFYY